MSSAARKKASEPRDDDVGAPRWTCSRSPPRRLVPQCRAPAKAAAKPELPAPAPDPAPPKPAAPPARRATAESHGAEAARDLGLGVLRQEPPPAGLRQPVEGSAHHHQGSGRQLARRLRGGRASCPSCTSRSTTWRWRRSDRQDAELTKGEGRFLRGRAGQRPRHRQGAGAEDLRQAPLRVEVPPPEAVARTAGHRHLGGRHVRPAHDRQADPGRPAASARARRRTSSTSSSTRARTSRSSRTTRRSRSGTRSTAPGSSSRSSPTGSRGQRFVNRYVEHTALANPHATHPLHAAGGRGSACGHGPAGQRDADASRARPPSCRRKRSRSSRTRTASSWARSC